jgi:acetyltransferase-like isoleucine patch superfamily enzyme
MPPKPLPEHELLKAPREGASDDTVKIVRWLVADGTRVRRGEPVVEIETSKAAIVVEAHRDGYLQPLAAVEQRVDVGTGLAAISDVPRAAATLPPASAASVTISDKARAMMQTHALTELDFPGMAVVRLVDVERRAAAKQGASSTAQPTPDRAAPAAKFLGEALDPARDWDAVLAEPWLGELQGRLTSLRRRLKAKFLRHVPLGSLLHDRWALAREYGFGEGSSVYDECVIFGDVQVGTHVWVGPYTILDGAHSPLSIGDYSSIGTGCHVYTHNTIERALTAGRAATFTRPTRIGRACFLSPQCIIGPGTVLGDHTFVAAGSFVQGEFASHSFLAGNPARRVGRVEIKDGRALLIREAEG